MHCTRLSFVILTILAAVSFLLYGNFNFKYQPVGKNPHCDSFLDFLRRADLFSDLFLIDRTILAAIHSGDDNFQPCDNFRSTPVWFGLLNSTSLSRFRSQFSPVPLSLVNFDYFILQSGQIRVGVAKVETFRKFWKIAKTSENPPRAILPSNLTKLSFNNDAKINLNVPANVEFFLWQLKRSELLECNQTAAESVRNYRLAHNRSLTPTIDDEKFKLLPLARDIFYGSRKDTFLEGGTLLGWYRDCDVVADTNDFDLALKSTSYDSEFEDKLIKEKRIKLVTMLGRANDSLELQFILNGFRLDLFIYYELNSNESYISGMDVAIKTSVQFVLPPLKGICSAVVRQELFFVPCNNLEFLIAYYGPHWYIPHFTDVYGWDSSPKNVRLGKRWSDAEWSPLFRTKFP